MIRLAIAGLALAAWIGAPARRVHAQTPGDPGASHLEQNVPNPFTPPFSSTIVAYQVDHEAHVRLTVYNLLAQEVAVLVDRVEDRGRYVVPWSGLDVNGDPVPAGVYWYKLQVGDQTVGLKQMRVREAGDAAPRTGGTG